jgi:hypothetical protein
MKQNNQGSWAARLRKITALCLALVATSSAWADDKVTAIVKPGETQQIVIALQNSDEAPYTAFQMDIVLPEGVEFAEGDDVVTLYRGHSSHKVEKNISGSTMKIVAYSYDGSTGNERFDGTSGNLLIVKVKSTKDFTSSEYAVKDIIQKQIFVGTNLRGINEISDNSSLEGHEGETHPIYAVKLGDIDENSVINTVDASLILMKLVGNPIPNDVTYNDDVDDVDGNGKLNTVDATEILLQTLK